MLTIHSIGHSTRSIEDFIVLLKTHGVRQLADIRSIPRSRRHPQFCDDALSCSLMAENIVYRHFPDLGGKRTVRAGSVNHACREGGGMQAYADHMATPVFTRALDQLMEWATIAPTAMMCAEAKPSECHRQLTADALTFGGVGVWHITSPAAPTLHQPNDHAILRDGKLIYPPKQGVLF